MISFSDRRLPISLLVSKALLIVKALSDITFGIKSAFDSKSAFRYHFWMQKCKIGAFGLDYYLMRKSKQITADYLPKQMKFWKDMEDTMNQLESKLTVYTRLLPAENSLGIPTRALFNKVLAHMEALKDRREASQDFLPRKLLSDQHHPIYLVNRLLEEVKPPPPFIPTLTRRHSFS